MRHRRAGSPVAIAGVALALLLALPPPASARELQMSGTWAIRNGQVFFPLQFARILPAGTMTSKGNLSKAFFFPNGPVLGHGVVSGAAAGQGDSLRIPQHVFTGSFTAAVPLQGVTLVQITTMFAIDAPHETATLRPGGGPGSFTWCPSNPACTDSPGPDPPPGGPGINGRIVYRAGADQFGGTIQLGLSGSGLLSLIHRAPTIQFAHHRLSIDPAAPAFAVGGAYATTLMLSPTPVAVSTYGGYWSNSGIIIYPGPLVTTMQGLTTSCAPDCGPLLVPPAISSTQWGFPATTGTVLAQQTTGTAGNDFFTVMGSDMRTALGAGNISLVAGGLTRRNAPLGPTSFAVFQKVWFSLAPPVPSLSPAGIAAVAVLLLLAVAWARWGRR